MKNLITSAILLLFLPICLYAQKESNDTPQASEENLTGTWTIDLRPTPDADPYFQSFVVESVEGNSFQGTFYGSAIEDPLINKNWDKLYFAFTTKDLNSEYFHSGYMQDGKLYGITYCPKREFTAPWTGEKK